MNRYVEELAKYGSLKSTKIIDAHTHMGDVYGTNLSVYDIEGCLKIMDEQNVEMIFCSPHGDLFDPLSVNTEIEEILRSHADRVKGYYGFNPCYAADYSRKIDNVPGDERFIGFKLLPEYHMTPLSDANYKRLFAVADESALLVLIHTWGGSAYNAPAQIEGVLKNYKRLKLLMGHSAPGEAEAAIRLAKDYENAYLDLCDIHRNNGIIERMVSAVGSEKVFYGTDMPWYDPAYAVGSVVFSHIAEQDMENILYRNAKNMINQVRR